jgi:hypothetical protein
VGLRDLSRLLALTLCTNRGEGGWGEVGPSSTFVRIWRAQRRKASSTFVPSNALASINPIPTINIRPNALSSQHGERSASKGEGTFS